MVYHGKISNFIFISFSCYTYLTPHILSCKFGEKSNDDKRSLFFGCIKYQLNSKKGETTLGVTGYHIHHHKKTKFFKNQQIQYSICLVSSSIIS